MALWTAIALSRLPFEQVSDNIVNTVNASLPPSNETIRTFPLPTEGFSENSPNDIKNLNSFRTDSPSLIPIRPVSFEQNCPTWNEINERLMAIIEDDNYPFIFSRNLTPDSGFYDIDSIFPTNLQVDPKDDDIRYLRSNQHQANNGNLFIDIPDAGQEISPAEELSPPDIPFFSEAHNNVSLAITKKGLVIEQHSDILLPEEPTLYKCDTAHRSNEHNNSRITDSDNTTGYHLSHEYHASIKDRDWLDPGHLQFLSVLSVSEKLSSSSDRICGTASNGKLENRWESKQTSTCLLNSKTGADGHYGYHYLQRGTLEYAFGHRLEKQSLPNYLPSLELLPESTLKTKTASSIEEYIKIAKYYLEVIDKLEEKFIHHQQIEHRHECLNKVYQNRNMMDLFSHIKANTWSSSRFTLKHDFSLFQKNRSLFSRLTGEKLPPHRIRKCEAPDCGYMEHIYQESNIFKYQSDMVPTDGIIITLPHVEY